jgi:threonine dehydrogenase-like Zn-dependent dehydrogenase
MILTVEKHTHHTLARTFMKANVFRGPGRFGLEEKPIPQAGPGEAVVRVRLTTICGTDIHIVRGEYPVRPGLTIGHEAVGVIHEIGPGVTGYHVGQRVLVGAITPCGQCEPCLSHHTSQCGGLLGGWKLGNTIDGTQAEYFVVPYAQANLTVIPDGLPTSRCCYWRTLPQPDSPPPRAARFAWETSWRCLPKVQLDYAQLSGRG